MRGRGWGEGEGEGGVAVQTEKVDGRRSADGGRGDCETRSRIGRDAETDGNHGKPRRLLHADENFMDKNKKNKMLKSVEK